jgi:AcrR family transcriptional regulator
MKELSRKERDRKRKKEEILQTALSVFAKNGFHGTTMAQISQVSQYPLGTIYKFFPGKKQIYYDLVVGKAFELGEILLKISEKREFTPTRRLRECLIANAYFYRRNHEFIRIYISERSNLDAVLVPKLNEKINRLHEMMVQLLADLLREGIDAGIFKPYPPMEMASLFSDVLHSTSWNSLTQDESDEALERRLETAFAIFTGGIFSEDRGVSNEEEE